MKDKLIAVVILLVVIVFVTVNTIIIDKQIENFIGNIENIDTANEESNKYVEELYSDLLKKEAFLGLTVSHNDLTNIEDHFVELIGYLSIGDSDNASVTKGRLRHSLEHLKRLSTFTIEAII